MHTWRIVLYPFSLIYGLILSIRNYLYDWGIFHGEQIPGKSICIGNITVGGTGKSPLTAFLTKALISNNPVILSRGYGRKTKGLRWATGSSNAVEIGDEPMMYWNAFQQQVPVFVAEKRIAGVQSIREQYIDSPILLDDAFQHRAVKAGLNILLMTYSRPIFADFPFPAGNLRESRAGMKRADIVVVTKTPSSLSEDQKTPFYQKIPLSKENIYFSQIVYGELVPLFGTSLEGFNSVVLVTAIAQPQPLFEHLSKQFKVTQLNFPDHHQFTLQDIQQIQRKVANFTSEKVAVITTEKDAVRLKQWETEIREYHLPLFQQNMSIKIDREEEFLKQINDYVVGTNERSC